MEDGVVDELGDDQLEIAKPPWIEPRAEQFAEEGPRLEFLVAADIITTVAVSPSFRSAGVLAIIVVIRTFLSMALQLELDGRWPWQRAPAGAR